MAPARLVTHGSASLQAAVQQGRAVGQLALPVVAAVLELDDAHGLRGVEGLVRGAHAVARAVAQAPDAEAHVEVRDRHRAELVAGDGALLLDALLGDDAVLLEEGHARLRVLCDHLVDGGLHVGLRERVPVLVELLVRLQELVSVPARKVLGKLVQQRERLLPGRGLVELSTGDPQVSERALDLCHLVDVTNLLSQLQGCLRRVHRNVGVLRQRRHAVQHLDLALLVPRRAALLDKLLHGIKARVGALHRGRRQDDSAHHVGSSLLLALERGKLLLCLRETILRGLAHDVRLNQQLHGSRSGLPVAQVLGD
mmetsp:Transcript_16020/g.43561  ORF Transcript_16020/g.43561 Transcript_16020/m.43561 type:complete len:311 (+) Transcript_16020:239-1171(+)